MLYLYDWKLIVMGRTTAPRQEVLVHRLLYHTYGSTRSVYQDSRPSTVFILDYESAIDG